MLQEMAYKQLFYHICCQEIIAKVIEHRRYCALGEKLALNCPGIQDFIDGTMTGASLDITDQWHDNEGASVRQEIQTMMAIEARISAIKEHSKMSLDTKDD